MATSDILESLIEKVAFLSCILNVYFNFQNIGHTSLQSLRIFLYLKR